MLKPDAIMRKFHGLFAVLCLISALPMSARAAPESSLGPKLLRAIQYAAVTRASFGPNCRGNSLVSQLPRYKSICPKLTAIPDDVMESAALPYLECHISHELAKQAINFWSSNRGRALTQTIIKEIETGRFDQLSPEELKMLDRANKTPYGRALKDFAADKRVSTAVIDAMSAYEPELRRRP
jgi:hypothetical protein